MWAALISGILHQCDSLAEIVRLLQGNKDVRSVCGFAGDNLPGEDALGRFLKKLVQHQVLLEECFEGLVEKLRQLLPGFGRKVVVDSTDVKAFSNGRRQKKSDPDARWGAKGAGQHPNKKADSNSAEKEPEKRRSRDLYWWFGYKLHLLVDGVYELPIAFEVTPANESDTKQMEVF